VGPRSEHSEGGLQSFFYAIMLTTQIVCIYRIEITIENGMSSTAPIEQVSIPLSGWELKDLTFIDDEELMLAVSKTGK